MLAGPEVLGTLSSPGIGGTEVILTFAEITLALLLFSDAARLGIGAAIRDSKPALRVLAIGFPLTSTIRSRRHSRAACASEMNTPSTSSAGEVSSAANSVRTASGRRAAAGNPDPL